MHEVPNRFWFITLDLTSFILEQAKLALEYDRECGYMIRVPFSSPASGQRLITRVIDYAFTKLLDIAVKLEQAERLAFLSCIEKIAVSICMNIFV